MEDWTFKELVDKIEEQQRVIDYTLKKIGQLEIKLDKLEEPAKKFYDKLVDRGIIK
jgi:uncharacterized protein YaaN involved in tellurite resistance